MWLGQVSVPALKIMVTDHGQRSEMIRANLTWFQNREYGFIHVCSNEPKGTAFTPEVILNVSYDINSEMKSRINLYGTDWSKFNYFPFRFANYPPTMLFVSSMIREGSVFFSVTTSVEEEAPQQEWHNVNPDWQMHQIMWEARWGRAPLLYWWNLCTSGPWERRLWWISFDFNRNPDNSSPDYSHVFHISRLNKKPWPQIESMLVSSQFHRMNVLYEAYIYKVGQLKKKKTRDQSIFQNTYYMCAFIKRSISKKDALSSSL